MFKKSIQNLREAQKTSFSSTKPLTKNNLHGTALVIIFFKLSFLKFFETYISNQATQKLQNPCLFYTCIISAQIMQLNFKTINFYVRKSINH